MAARRRRVKLASSASPTEAAGFASETDSRSGVRPIRVKRCESLLGGFLAQSHKAVKRGGPFVNRQLTRLEAIEQIVRQFKRPSASRRPVGQQVGYWIALFDIQPEELTEAGLTYEALQCLKSCFC